MQTEKLIALVAYIMFPFPVLPGIESRQGECKGIAHHEYDFLRRQTGLGVLRLIMLLIILKAEWKVFAFDEIVAEDKISLNITWLKDKSLTDLDSLPDPDVLAEE